MKAIKRVKEISQKLPGRYFIHAADQDTVLTSIYTSNRADGELVQIHYTVSE